MSTPRPNLRLVTPLDPFEQAMRDDPDYAQGKSREQETRDSMMILALVVILFLIFAIGLLVMVNSVMGGPIAPLVTLFLSVLATAVVGYIVVRTGLEGLHAYRAWKARQG